ncbi:hypothetical protein GGI05_006742, partial [Coemansia sp. RSA 2603]
MTVIPDTVERKSPEFQENARSMAEVVADLEAKVRQAALGGSAAARKKHTARGKLLPRERVAQLLDPGAPFLELSQLAGMGL